jgi:hypothetical protein
MFLKAVFTFFFTLAFIAPAYAQEISIGKDGNIRNVETRALAIDNTGAYLATRSVLYRTGDISSNERWEEVFSLPPGENEITALGACGKNVLVGTRRGLFRSDDGGKIWRDVFRTIIPDKNNILSIDISKYRSKKVIISTARGVFLSEDFGTSWIDVSSNLANKRIKCAALNKEVMYASGDDGLYIRRPGEAGWERIFVNSAVENSSTEESEELQEMPEAEDETSSVNCVSIKSQRVYIGINKNISYSDDEGKTWQPISKSGLIGSVNYILPSKKTDKLYCASSRGVFEFDNDKAIWRELCKGMDKTLNVTGLVFCSADEPALWAVTEKGMYRVEVGRYSADQYLDVERNLKSFKIAFENEPSLRELQQAALKFCDVNPDKIKNWQRDSKLKALVPKVALGVGNKISSNGEIYTSATKDYYYVGPDDYSNNVDVTISWDLGNLIWSDSQTSIDVRSRLNTQLRNDILDNLRRAYYERKRLQFELIASPPKDVKSRFERELRIQELTQAIDDLTGNYLSDNTKVEKKQ